MRLDQEPVVLTSLVQGHHRDRIHIAAELREGFQFTILSLIYLKGSCYLLHTFHLSAASDAGHGNSDVHCWTESLIKKIGLKEYLSVCYGYNISRDICGNITGLRLDYRQGCQRASCLDLAQERRRKVIHLFCNVLLSNNFRSSFKKAGMKVEYISRISFSA